MFVSTVFKFKSELTFDKQINIEVKNSFFNLEKIARLKSVLSFNDFGESGSCFYEVLSNVFKTLNSLASEISLNL